MKLSKRLMIIITIVVISALCFCLILLYSLNRRYSDFINQYEFSRFFSALKYINEVDALLSSNDLSLFYEDIDYHIAEVNKATQVFSEIVKDYNQIYDKEEPQPKLLLNWLISLKHTLLKENKSEIDVEAFRIKFRNLNNISKEIYGLNDSFTAQDYIRQGFGNDSWLSWLKKADVIIMEENIIE